LADKQAG